MKPVSIFAVPYQAPTLEPAGAALAAIPNRPTRQPKTPRRRPLVSAERAARLQRSRTWAGSSSLPPGLRWHFTEGQRAVLAILCEIVKAEGTCSASYGELARRAGVSRETAKRAIAEAVRLRLVVLEERRRRGLPSLTNLVRIVDPTWLAWLERGGRGSDVTHQRDSYLSKGKKRGGTRPTSHRPHSGHRPADRQSRSAHSSG